MIVSVRPERIRILARGTTVNPKDNNVEGKVRDLIFVGETITYLVETALGVPMRVKELNSEDRPLFDRGEEVCLVWQPESMFPLPSTEQEKEEPHDTRALWKTAD